MPQKALKQLFGPDSRLLGLLWRCGLPFRGLIIGSILLIMGAALISLALPYLTKVAIDRYILPLGRLAVLKDGSWPPELGTVKLADLTKTATNGTYFLPPDLAAQLDLRQEKRLTLAGVLTPGRYFYRPFDQDLTEENAKIAAETQKELLVWPQGVAVAERDLPKLPGSLNLVLRAADAQGLKTLAFGFALLMVLGYFFDLGQRYCLESGAQKMTHDLRAKVMAHLLTLNQSFFDHEQTGRLTSRLTSDVNNINALVKSTAASFFSDLLSLVGVTVVMIWLNPFLAFITLLITPLAAVLSWRYGREARAIHRDLRAKAAAINQSFNESIAGLAIIQAFTREKESVARFEALNEENYQAGYRQVSQVAVFLPLVDLCATFVLALVLWHGGLGALEETVTLGVLAAFVGYANRFFIPIKDLAEKVNAFQSAFASIERLEELLSVTDALTPQEPILSPPAGGGRVEIKNLSFRYGQGRPVVLTDLNVVIEPGESVAIVGATGSGKSSLISLLLRFYDPTEGEILFDGLPLKRLDLKAHRRRVSLVTQDVYLTSGTVMDNLRLGRKELSDEAIYAATLAVGADEFIKKLPQGYQETLGAEGKSLSAGQRQLLACARALIEAPRFIILDEATAFVDNESELLIERALATVLAGRTSIIVAHRLSTVRRANRVLVLDRGRLVEVGTHEELLALNGLYSHLALLQGLK